MKISQKCANIDGSTTIAAMRYTGMQACRLSTSITWDGLLVAAFIAVGVVSFSQLLGY